MGHDLWRNWEQLSGGGPTPINQGLLASPDRAQTPVMIIRSLPQVGMDKVQNTCQSGEEATTKTKGQPPALASMESLRGPLARSNRANLNHNQEDGTRDRAPVELRYPHNSKRWGLGVGQVPGERALEGVFAIGKVVKTNGVIFTAGQLICPFRGHQQSKRPTHLTRRSYSSQIGNTPRVGRKSHR